mgnify:CR=1 FL=1
MDKDTILYHAYMNGLIDYMNHETPFPYYYVPKDIEPNQVYKFAEDILNHKDG